MEAIFHINYELPFKEIIPKAIGATYSKETEETLRYRPSLPKCFLSINSPLSLKLTFNKSHPPATAWTMFETNNKAEKYRYTYTKFNPFDVESLGEAISFITWYVKEYNGKKNHNRF